MTIDIISYTDGQYAALSEEQILEVERVQLKKNRLTEALKEKKRKEKFRLLKAGVFRSAIWEKICAALELEYTQEVEGLRDGLLFYLRFASKPDNEQTSSAPYAVDYSLSDTERFAVVKAYYDGHYTDGKQKFAAFKLDQVAARYLGEYYSPLYELYAAQAE